MPHYYKQLWNTLGVAGYWHLPLADKLDFTFHRKASDGGGGVTPDHPGSLSAVLHPLGITCLYQIQFLIMNIKKKEKAIRLDWTERKPLPPECLVN